MKKIFLLVFSCILFVACSDTGNEKLKSRIQKYEQENIKKIKGQTTSIRIYSGERYLIGFENVDSVQFAKDDLGFNQIYTNGIVIGGWQNSNSAVVMFKDI